MGFSRLHEPAIFAQSAQCVLRTQTQAANLSHQETTDDTARTLEHVAAPNVSQSRELGLSSKALASVARRRKRAIKSVHCLFNHKRRLLLPCGNVRAASAALRSFKSQVHISSRISSRFFVHSTYGRNRMYLIDIERSQSEGTVRLKRFHTTPIGTYAILSHTWGEEEVSNILQSTIHKCQY